MSSGLVAAATRSLHGRRCLDPFRAVIFLEGIFVRFLKYLHIKKVVPRFDTRVHVTHQHHSPLTPVVEKIFARVPCVRASVPELTPQSHVMHVLPDSTVLLYPQPLTLHFPSNNPYILRSHCALSLLTARSPYPFKRVHGLRTDLHSA